MKKTTINIIFSTVLLLNSYALADDKNSWSYTGDKKPDNWHKLSDDYTSCNENCMQSPFNIIPNYKVGLPEIKLSYGDEPLNLISNKNGLKIHINGSQLMNIGANDYELIQFHFHNPSEHQINGQAFPMEAHFVHKRKGDGAIIVLAVMIKEGNQNDEIAKIWSNIPKQFGDVMNDKVSINIQNLMPQNMQYMHFMGSLTTPPCSEGVSWYMLTTPIELSADQINAFKQIYGQNARPLQPSNNRLILE